MELRSLLAAGKRVNGDDRAADPTSSLRKLPVGVFVVSLLLLSLFVVVAVGGLGVYQQGNVVYHPIGHLAKYFPFWLVVCHCFVLFLSE